MTRATCSIQEDGTIELYFYRELDAAAHADVRAHIGTCRECAQALEELQVIRTALSARPDVSAPASGDWSAFMERLDGRLQAQAAPSQAPDVANADVKVVPFARPARLTTQPAMRLLATAALLAVVAITVFLSSRAGRGLLDDEAPPQKTELAAGSQELANDERMQAALTSVGLRHLERSKLVVLGLAAKEPSGGTEQDWAYERELASSLLNDTRIYRQAAEQRGLTRLASVMRDLELVLLQTSMAEATDRAALPQIQRLIQKRGLVAKMDVAGTTGLLP